MVRSRRAEMRRQLLIMVVGATAVSAVALAIYYALDLRHADPSRQRVFTMLWMAGNFVAVAFPLRRIRQLRRGR